MQKWKIQFSKIAQKQLNNLDNKPKFVIKKAIEEKLLKNPELELHSLFGQLAGYYKFRIGDYRLICHKDGTNFTVLVLKLGHRKNIYKQK